MNKTNNAASSLGDELGYNPYRDTKGRFDDGPQLLKALGKRKVSFDDNRRKIEAAKLRLQSEFQTPKKPEVKEKVIKEPKFKEVPGFDLSKIGGDAERMILWRDKELFPGQTYGEYYKTEKAKAADVFMLSPAEYRQALVDSGTYADIEAIERRIQKDKVEEYANDMRNGDKFPPAELLYNEDGYDGQEGLHRVYAAEQVGIEEIPVIVSHDTRNQPDLYKKYSDKITAPADLYEKEESITIDGNELDDALIQREIDTILGEINDKGYSERLDRLKRENRDGETLYSTVVDELANIDDSQVEMVLKLQAGYSKKTDSDPTQGVGNDNGTGSSPHLYNNQWPDYNMTAPEGYTILYTNTKSENIDAIMADGLKVGLNADGYRLSPEEGNQVWTDVGSPGSMAYGGNTVAFKVKNEEAEASKVNDTQHAIPHDIAPEDIMFVDKVLKSDSGVKVSNLPEYIERFGEEKFVTVTAKTGDGFSEQELRNLISVYKSQSAAPAAVEQEQDMSPEMDESTAGTENVPEKRINGVPVLLKENKHYAEILETFPIPAQKYYEMSDDELVDATRELIEENNYKLDIELSSIGSSVEELAEFNNRWSSWSDARLNKQYGAEKVKKMKDLFISNNKADAKDKLLLGDLANIKPIKAYKKDIPADSITIGSDKIGEPGQYLIYRAGDFSRKIAFADLDNEVANDYSRRGFGRNDGVVQGYLVDIKNPFVSTDIPDALSKLGSKKSFRELGYVGADNFISKELAARGYDAWIKTKPERPANIEVNLIKGQDAYKSAKSGDSLVEGYTYRKRLLDVPTTLLQQDIDMPNTEFKAWTDERGASILKDSGVFEEYTGSSFRDFSSWSVKAIREAADIPMEEQPEYTSYSPKRAFRWMFENEPERFNEYLAFREAIDTFKAQYRGEA